MINNILSPVIFAHRGASRFAPENTIPAFSLALDQGASAIEFDVKLTADQEVIVIHDQTVDRTTDGTGDVRKQNLADLQRLDAGVRFNHQFPGTRIPTLAQVFEAVGDRLYMNIELTNYATPADQLVPRVVDLVRQYGMEKRVLFSSFFPRNLHITKRLLSSVPCGLLIWPGWMGWWGRTFGVGNKDYTSLHPHVTNVDSGMISRAHALGKRVNVWTVNEREDFIRLIGWGVDGIFTDDPALGLSILGRGK